MNGPKELAALHHALTEVFSGAELIDAEAVRDQLADIGFHIVEKESLMPAHQCTRAV